jgi:hypothetical protein
MQTQTTSATPEKTGNQSDAIYAAFLTRVQERFAKNAAGASLFTTNAHLWTHYLESFQLSERQHHNCNACHHFIKRFGGLVTIDQSGNTRSALWDVADADPLHEPALRAMAGKVELAQVTGVFLSAESVFGQPETGAWRHLAVFPPAESRYSGALLTPWQAMAEKREDFRTVSRALAEFPHSLLEQAVALLETEALYRSEKVIGPARWLRDVHAALKGVRGPRRDNLLWRFVAVAPAGFCHPRSSMVGTLLADLANGLSFEDASKRFASKMNPAQYQRPQAAPTAGNIAQAEKVVEKLGIARSLERRFARLEEVKTIWTPPVAESPAPSGGVFSHLKPRGASSVRTADVPKQAITWEKFSRTVLPDAKSIEVSVPSEGNFAALLTATHADAPPIFQWDRLEQRNPFSIYLYTRGSSARQWGLIAGNWAPVTGISLRPSQWQEGFEHMGIGALLIIDGAIDAQDSGACIFPEMLKSELHGIRATIEAFSNGAKRTGREQGSACGLLVGKDGIALVRVTNAAGVRAQYNIDRWD